MSDKKNELLPTRASLLERMRDWQNQTSWQEFFDLYWKLIYGVARKAGLSDSEAQDVVQEVLVHVAKQMPTFRFDPALGSFKGWLCTKTRWCIFAQFHQRARHPLPTPPVNNDSSLSPEIPDPAASAMDEAWEREWQQSLFESAFSQLKHRHDGQDLQIFDFYVRKELPAKEVAARFGVSVDQVHLAKHRVKEALKKEIARLEREGT